jgi:hypothetical protein
MDMDGTELVTAVRTDASTELGRLGSEKALIATTNAVLEREEVLAAAAASERRAAETFREWADDEEHDAARRAFAAVAETEESHLNRITERLDGEPGEDDQPDSLHEYLRDLTGTPERVGAGLVGRPLASERTLLQVINFFVNEADERTADLFRDLRSETAALTDEGAELLDDVCETDDEWERARRAAEGVIEVAYQQYASTLEGMGLDPAPVC